VSIPQRGGCKTPQRRAYERSPAFKQGQRFRAGIEGRISVLMRGRGMKRCRAEGAERFALFVGAAVLANRQRAIALAAVKDKPFGWPRKARPSLTATRPDGAVELRSGRKNGSAGVKQKNGCDSSFRAKILSSRYARVAINFPGTKNKNTGGFSHQTPWSCLIPRGRGFSTA
jgi:hypothetical protein